MAGALSPQHRPTLTPRTNAREAEQLAPFPFHSVAKAAGAHPAAELIWAQEEPKNMGAYAHVAPRIATALRAGAAGRAAAAGKSPAVNWQRQLLYRCCVCVRVYISWRFML